MKRIIKTLLVFFISSSLWAQATVSIDNVNEQYSLGDLVEVNLNIETLESFNNIHYSLDYNSDALEFIDYRTTDITAPNISKVLYATNKSHDQLTGRVIFSILWNENQSFFGKSNFLSVKFKVKKRANNLDFKFKNYGVKKLTDTGTGENINTLWKNSVSFNVADSSESSFIFINSPVNNSVVRYKEGETNSIKVSVISSKVRGYKIKIVNDSIGYTSELRDSTLGFAEDVPVYLREGLNILTAHLTTPNGVTVAIDSLTIHCKPDNSVLSFENPEQNIVLNKNKVSVQVSSKIPNVKINGSNADYIGFKNSDNINVYYKDVWLTPGFNTILAEAVSDNNELYKEELTLFYEKRDEVFKITTPVDGDIVKLESGLSLTFKGEISQKYSDNGNINQVTYDAVFYPSKYESTPIELVNNGIAKIDEYTSADGINECAYKFYNTTPIDISRKGAGTLKLIVYKNRDINTYEDKQITYLKIDDSKLSIILNQPRIYSVDHLLNQQIIDHFHSYTANRVNSFFNIEVNSDSELALRKTLNKVKILTPELWNSEREGLIELKDSSMLYYSNKNGIARILNKKVESNNWQHYISDTNKFYIYDIVETSKGLMLGVSNYVMDGNTGLFLLKDNVLTNIIIGKPITHVQFIRKVGDTIFLYGNNYSHIYSFNINDLEPYGDKLKVDLVNSYSLRNSLNLKDFKISPTLKTAALLTNGGDLTLFKNINNEFVKKEFINNHKFRSVKEIHFGEYESGAYNCYLIEGDTSLSTVMEKKSDGSLIDSATIENLPQGTLLATAFKNNNFHLLTKSGLDNKITRGKFFFNRFMKEEYSIYSSTYALDNLNSDLIVTRYNGYFWGDGTLRKLYNFTSEIEESGYAKFSYSNPDVSGIEGFSFSIPGKWVDSNKLSFDFSFNNGLYSSQNFNNLDSGLTIAQWHNLYKDSNDFRSVLSYDSNLQEYKVDVDFLTNRESAVIDFLFRLNAFGTTSPVIRNLKIKKKVPVKLPKIDSSSANISIAGRVTDPTVNKIRINIVPGLNNSDISATAQTEIPLDLNGGFKFEGIINTSKSVETVELSCFNNVESVTETFEINLFDSNNGLSNTAFYTPDGLPVTFDIDRFEQTEDTIYISTDYFGLIGSVVGYEILSLDESTIIKQGLLQTTGIVDMANNSEVGSVVKQPITLLAGSQKIRVFIENPGGKREYFFLNPVSKSLPVFIYNITTDQEGIIITSNGIEPFSNPLLRVENLTVDQQFPLLLNEVISGNSYVFSNRVNLSGSIESLNSLTNVKIRSLSNEITFNNLREREVIVDVDEINNFNFDLIAELPDNSDPDTSYYIVIEPLAPYLMNLKSVIKIDLIKNYKDTNIVPDFSLMDGHKWSQNELRNLSKPISIGFRRAIPEGAELKLDLNFTKEIKGLLKRDPNFINRYLLIDDFGNSINLTDVKYGVNRISWELYYNDNVTISSSASNRVEMNDYLFELTASSGIIDTVIDYPYNDGLYYKESTLIDIPYTKDSDTVLELIINRSSKGVIDDSSVSGVISLLGGYLKEGKNDIVIKADNLLGSISKEYTLYYDTQPPIIGKEEVTIDNSTNKIKTISVLITEANLDSIKLVSIKNGIKSNVPSDGIITPVSSNHYRVRWELDHLIPGVNPHMNLEELQIVVEDKSLNRTETLPFKGPKSVTDGIFDGLKLFTENINNPDDSYYNNDPAAMYRKTPSGYSNNWVFYDSNPIINSSRSIDINSAPTDVSPFVFERPRNLTLDGFKFEHNPKRPLVINNSVNSDLYIGNNITIPLGQTVDINVNKVVPEAPKPRIVLDKDYEEFSMNLVVRFEESKAYDFNPEDIVRLVSFDTKLQDIRDYYIGYKRNINRTDVDLYFIAKGQETKIVNLKSGVKSGDWHNLLFNISLTGNFLRFYLNDDAPVTVSYPNSRQIVPYDLLLIDTEFYLGDKDGSKNGHFTITQGFYTDKLIDAVSIPGYYDHISNGYQIPDTLPYYKYNFSLDSNGQAVEAGSSPHNIRFMGNSITKDEDREYHSNGSALIGSKYRRNAIKNSGELLLFNDSTSPFKSNITTSMGTRTFKLNLVNENEKGRYSFGGTTSHGLTTDKYYSISGTVNKLASVQSDLNTLNAEMVLVFNGDEKRYKLDNGDFHFVYENKNNSIPNRVVLYIETYDNLEIGNNLQFIEGNSIISDDVLVRDNLSSNSKYASTKYYFNNQGSVGFSYKPFNTNHLGLVDYEAILFSSDFITVFTEFRDDKMCYSAKVGADNVVLKSSVPVKEGWTDILVTYSQDLNVARLFINGVIADYVDAPITLPINNSYSSIGDNVFIGGKPNNLYAEGFIDNLEITNFYKEPVITSVESIDLKYSEDVATNRVELHVTAPNSSITEWKTEIYSILSNTNTSAPHFDTFSGNGTTIYSLPSNITPGQYFARLNGRINSKRVSRELRFIRDDKPCFLVKNAPKLSIPNKVDQVLKFDIKFDNTYLTSIDNSKYAGFVLQLSNLDGSQKEMIYLYQNFNDQDNTSWVYKYANDLGWTPVTVTNNAVTLQFIDQDWADNIYYSYDSFYFTLGNVPVISQLPINTETKVIPVAAIESVDVISKNVVDINNETLKFEYKLDIKIKGSSEGQQFENIDDFALRYTVGNEIISSTVPFTSNGFIELYYDDILKERPYGQYDIKLELIYMGDSFETKIQPIEWKEFKYSEKIKSKSHSLEIKSLDLINTKIDSVNNYNLGDFYLSFDHIYNNINTDVALYYIVKVYKSENGRLVLSREYPKELVIGSYKIIENIELPNGSSRVEVELFEEIMTTGLNGVIAEAGLIRTIHADISLSASAPELFLTNKVPYYAPYNSMTFTWDGSVDGQNLSSIKYQYNFDNQGWSAPNSQCKKLELFNLSEGFHELRIRASHNGQLSTEVKSRYFVDVTKPVIDEAKVSYELLLNDTIITNDKHVPNGIRFSGAPGAVLDSSLTLFSINDREIIVSENGEFKTGTLPLGNEGINSYTFTAYDRVGNKSVYTKEISNDFIEILSPKDLRVQFAPFTMVGKISDNITEDMTIYIQDPLHDEIWHEAQINSDRVFFIDDLSINPGNSSRDSETNFRLKIVFSSGNTYYKDIKILAGDLYRPLKVQLSKQATQGAGEPVEITINAECMLSEIASWSIDFDGDGIYDDIFVTDNTDVSRKSWNHSYSTLGEIRPRVRVITRNGEYFTQSESLIIHEEIKSASSTKITKPVDMDIVTLQDKSNKVFVLSGDKLSSKIDVLEVGSNEDFFSNILYSVDIKELINRETPSKIVSLSDKSFLVVTERFSSNIKEGKIYHFNMNEFGNFVPIDTFRMIGYISSIAASDNYIFITQKDNSKVTRLTRSQDIVDYSQPEVFEMKIPLGNRVLANGTPITYFNGSIFAADRGNQRIIEYTESIEPISYWGNYGTNDKEFIQVNLLNGYGNRLFISDSSREDIQVFDSDLRVVSSLNSNGSYLNTNFFTNVVSINAIGREAAGRLYYYIIALSESTETLSLVRLPQWEEMRAKTRNNKIVFLKDKEVFTAKPNGSDLKKVLSTDSLPRIEGVVDYPTLSPDGRRLAFISRENIYTGGNEEVLADTWVYDNLYFMNIGDDRPVKILLNGLDNYEIGRPVFNSNGDTIIFSARTESSYWQAYEYSCVDGTVSQLFNSLENIRYPYYSPDDRYVVYSTDYDGDLDLEIFDKENPDVRIEVTSNNFRDSFPVWSSVYPFEIANTQSNIESKISFVSDRGFKKGVHYVYIAKPTVNDIRVVTKGDLDIGDDPDSAAIEVTTPDYEGGYPAFTGDGEKIVYEEYDGATQNLVCWDIKNSVKTAMNLPERSQKPSGMKNSITGFSAELINGNEVKLNWNPYTDHETVYRLEYKKATENLNTVNKKIDSQDGTVISGLEMNSDYIMRIYIEENEEIVAQTKWLKVEVPEVVAKPSFSIDSDNPYLVNLHAWKPEQTTNWTFSWVIDNQEITTAQTSQDFQYQFGTSGEKTIQLKASNREGNFTSISKSFTVNIVSDIKPIIESTLISGGSRYIELDATKSVGRRINMSSALWTITGPGQMTPLTFTGAKPIIDVSHIKHKVNVSLKISRQMVTGQAETDVIEVNKVIDLDYQEIKPIITYEANLDNSRLLLFDGSKSLGNIDWRTAKWSLFSDGELLHRVDGVSNFNYLFRENSRPVPYAVSLTVAESATGITKTVSQTVSVDPAEIEPVIDYEIIRLLDENQEVGVKVVLTATGSKGSRIDFNATEWNLPLAAQHGDQPKQKGPTAIFNLVNPGSLSQIEVSVTLLRQGGIDPVTKTEIIQVDSTGISETEIFVNRRTEETSEGNVIILDVLESKGTNIDWKNTEWLVNGQFSFKGPVARIDRSYTGEKQNLSYTVILYRFGSDPITKTGLLPLYEYMIRPHISRIKQSDLNHTQTLTVKETEGLNIDWGRTLWTIYDGSESEVQKRGATIMHTFVPKSKASGYPVMVEMYLKNSDTPFYGYKSIQIEGEELNPIIEWDNAIGNFETSGDTQVISFSALSSTGSCIDWSQTKWNFGDGTAPQYGASVQHKYASSMTNKEYTVALTITSQTRSGAKESKTVYKNINIGADEIRPVILAKVDTASNNLILSAEGSEGRALLIDRSVWMFAGKGDSENFSRSKGSVETNSSSKSVSIKAGSSTASVTTNISSSNSEQDSNSNNQSFSTQNTHTGAICRRYIEDFDFNSFNGSTTENHYVWVTLFVYRLNPDGSTSGVTFTEKINLTAVINAGVNGKEYR